MIAPTECERRLSKSTGLPGEFVPRCELDGTFEPKQCHGSIGYCWCVDVITGKEISGTRKNVRVNTTVTCKPPCEKACPRSYIPVCSSDGLTYINKCELEIAICKNPSVTLKSEGACPISVNLQNSPPSKIFCSKKKTNKTSTTEDPSRKNRAD